MGKADTIDLQVNGMPFKLEVDENRSLLDVLREELGLKGSHFGCGLGLCGACTVLVDRRPVPACDTPAWSVAGKEVTTIEGIAVHGLAKELQDEFVRQSAAQCGYCTSGMIVACTGLLLANNAPSDAEIKGALDGNLCRCGAHLRIVRAVQNVREFLNQARHE
ncbi:(2Fe-2S)-binding protein [Paralcaligenes sp. KSB-10]|uniref:(2Fe-2S)-binding protein n=1 Tax=Paralcaligenes sp. KSB-10 TaxID=2901142 RepID=UPI001E30A9A3|nr:(2Fe-2S)-binding protein [Paralcaligenes sp. KSB-10]UHL65025.1 (2Fe-2S)-binding protein [Paralcaligenes sp. KSB-10]